MKVKFLSLILMFLIAQNIAAQNKRMDVGVTSIDFAYGAFSLLSGDIAIPLNQNFNLTNNKLYSIGLHQSFTKSLALKAAFDYGFYTATENNVLLYYCNLFGFSVRGEYDFLNFGKIFNNSIYLFAGAGVTFVSGKSLSTDGVSSFNNTNPLSPIPFVPMGLGYRVKVYDRISLGLEADLHYFISDIIDGNAKPNSYPHDMISTISINLKYQIFGKNFRSYKKNCNCE